LDKDTHLNSTEHKTSPHINIQYHDTPHGNINYESIRHNLEYVLLGVAISSIFMCHCTECRGAVDEPMYCVQHASAKK